MIGLENESIIEGAQKILGSRLESLKNPPQGMGSTVFFVRDCQGREYALKTGDDVDCDWYALKIITQNDIDLPIPKVCGYFESECGKTLVMERIRYPLLEEASAEEMGYLIPSMIKNLKILHTIRSFRSGAILSPVKSWKGFLLDKYSGEHPWYLWQKIAGREGVDGKLVRRAVDEIAGRLDEAELPEGEYSLLHTDFNQRNLFIDRERSRIAGIVDWSEAVFGDPLYDFARMHMFILHFQLGEEILVRYYDLLGLSSTEKAREELYLASIMLEYITWYSGINDNFSADRLRFHQEFLCRYL